MSEQRLSQEFHTKQLLQFAFPTIIMMVFLSLYTTVDGAFVSRFVGETALSAVNIVFPLISLFLAVALMLATGSNAIIARLMGEEQPEPARRFCALIYLVGAVMGLLLGIASFFLADPILRLLGCTPTLYPDAILYLKTLSLFAPMIFFQVFAQTFLVTAGKPQLGLCVIILSGVGNAVLDYVFMGPLQMGIAGAALATGIGYTLSGSLGFLYFALHRSGTLYFGKPLFELRRLLYSCYNGASELVSNLSMAITTLLFNLSMLHYVGEAGVAAVTIILYVQFIQDAVYLGYSYGVAPVISFQHGAQNCTQLRRVLRISLRFVAICSVAVIFLSILGAPFAARIFVAPDSPVFALAKQGFVLFALAYCFMGFNIFFSSFFTALGNGAVSAILSCLRTLVFLIASLIILPLIFGVNGIWLAVPLSEALTFLFSIFFYKRCQGRYGY